MTRARFFLLFKMKVNYINHKFQFYLGAGERLFVSTLRRTFYISPLSTFCTHTVYCIYSVYCIVYCIAIQQDTHSAFQVQCYHWAQGEGGCHCIFSSHENKYCRRWQKVPFKEYISLVEQTATPDRLKKVHSPNLSPSGSAKCSILLSRLEEVG